MSHRAGDNIFREEARAIRKSAMTWTPAKVGCYWDSGEYHISTFQVIGPFDGSGRLRSGYRLSREREPIGEYRTFEEATDAAERHALEVSL